MDMADEADDVLELEDEVQTESEEIEDEPTEDQPENEDGEPFIGFEGEEAAPASEGDSTVIRDLRRKLREKDRELAGLRRAPERIEVGEKPTLESCEYDEERFETALVQWRERKAQADAQTAEQQERAKRQQEAEEGLRSGYEASKASLGVADFEDREAAVIAALPADYDKLLLHSGKGAELIVALSNSPGKLEALAKSNPLEAAMMVGELRSKLQMGTRKAPQPDRPVRGNAAPASADKELARLEAEAERTGDRTKLIAYRRKLKA